MYHLSGRTIGESILCHDDPPGNAWLTHVREGLYRKEISFLKPISAIEKAFEQKLLFFLSV